MAVAPKCKICKEKIDKADVDSFVKESGGYFHVACENLKKKNSKTISCSHCKKEFSDESEIIKRGSLKFHKKCLDEYKRLVEEGERKTRERTCPHCKSKVDPLSDDSVDRGSNTYHGNCYAEAQKNKRDREELFDYISLKYNISFPTGMMMKQISEFHEKRGYSYRGMHTTLKYIFEVQKIPVTEGVGVGLIAYYYEKAKEYHKKLRKVGKMASGAKVNNTIVKVKVVEPKPKKKTGYIDLYSL